VKSLLPEIKESGEKKENALKHDGINAWQKMASLEVASTVSS